MASGGARKRPNCQVPYDHKVCDETDRGEWCTTDSWSAWEFYLNGEMGTDHGFLFLAIDRASES